MAVRKKKVTKKNGKVTVVGENTITSTTLAKAVDAVLRAKADEKTAKATVSKESKVITNIVDPYRDAEAKAGRYTKSYTVVGDTGEIKTVYSDSYTVKDADAAKALLPSDLLQERTRISVRSEVNDNDALQAELRNLLGDHFGKFFEENTVTTVVPGFDEKIYDTKTDLSEVRKVIVPKKSYVRT